MENIRNITLIGTSHIAKESVKKVTQTIIEEKPEIVALELDPGRAYALQHNIKRPKNITLLRSLGVSGFLFYLFGEVVQKKLGKIVNLQPGSEMLVAMKTSAKVGSKIALIVRDIQITLRRFSKHFRKRELLRIILDLITSVFKKNDLKIDLSKVPSDELIEYAMEQAKDNYPSLYKILVEERDIYMAKQLNKISLLYPDKQIVAVVGAGHIKGILNYLTKLNHTT